jgi:hypothetical protein
VAARAIDQRYVLTQAGRDDLRRAEALAWLFGPAPTVAEARIDQGRGR